MSRRARYLLAAAALCAALAGYWLAQQLDRAGPRLASGTWLPQGKPLGELTLTDTAGRAFTRGDHDGPALVFFGFTSCPDVCPGTLATLAEVHRRAPVEGLQVLFISVDPERDTPAVLSAYLRAFDPAFIGLTAAAPPLGELAADFGVAAHRVGLAGGGYTMDHSAVVFLLDGARIAALFTPPFSAAGLTADLRRAAPYLHAHPPGS
jgi:protein SCO1/2